MADKDLRQIINFIKVGERYESLKEIAITIGISDTAIYKAVSKNPGTLNLDNLERKLKKHFPTYFPDENVVQEAGSDYKKSDDWSKDDIDESIALHKSAEERLTQITNTIKLMESRLVGLRSEKEAILMEFPHLR